MPDSSLEAECGRCGTSVWVENSLSYPDTIECPQCHEEIQIPEDA